MADPTREQVFEALLALLQDKIPGIRTYTRKVGLPTEFQAAAQPALVLFSPMENTNQGGLGSPPRRTWHFSIIVYFRVPRNDAGETVMNPLLEAVEAALESGPSFPAITLGGLVSHCWLEGDTVKESGDTDADGQGGFVVPGKILVP